MVDATVTDAELVAACRAGDAAAWKVLVERFSRYVKAIATRAYRLPEHDAEEVFQTVFMRVFERLDTLRSDDAVRPWIGQLTRNCCLDLIRASGRVTPVEEMDETAADEVIDELDEAMAVRDSMSRLTPECREILDRFFAQDESYRTIGEALGLPPGTIASRISRCLGKLRNELTT